MGLYNTLPEGLDEVDVIIAGGGTSGCVVAGRLAEADPKLSILVIESGPDNYNREDVVNPLLFIDHIVNPTLKTHQFYMGKKSEHLAGRTPITSTGGILGGGSSVNASIYARPQRSDFDSWNTPGWTADEVFPYFRKFETYHGTDPSSVHGTSGPIHVSTGPFLNSAVQDAVFAATAARGYPEKEQPDGLGFGRWPRFISPDGKRQDAAHAYLHPRLRDGAHPNLHVLVETSVVRVLFSGGKRASAVEVVPSPKWQPDAAPTAKTVGARKLVVLSAGVFGSPAILERSGIGAADVLQRAGVEVVAENPAVGENLQDHSVAISQYKTTLEPGQTSDEIYSRRLPRAEALAKGDKRLGWTFYDVAGKIRPSEDAVAAFKLEVKEAWDRDFKNVPDRPLALPFFQSGYFGDFSTLPPGQYFGAGFAVIHPYSRGRVHITGPNVTDPPSFDAPLLNDAGDVDLKVHVWGYKTMREIMRRTAFFSGEIAMWHPTFPASSAAAPVDGPLASPASDIEYTAEDDEAIETFLRGRVGSLWHTLGTARMAPREEGGVVDAKLDIYGVEGLKVVDLSIVPRIVGSVPNSTALMIGEKGAELVAGELGLELRFAGAT